MKIFINLPNIFLWLRIIQYVEEGEVSPYPFSLSLLWLSLDHPTPTFLERVDVKTNFVIHGSPTEKILLLVIKSTLESVEK